MKYLKVAWNLFSKYNNFIWFLCSAVYLFLASRGIYHLDINSYVWNGIIVGSSITGLLHDVKENLQAKAEAKKKLLAVYR